MRDAIARLSEQHANDAKQQLNPPALSGKPASEIDAIVSYVHWLMDRDSKAGPLKSLQGMIWEEGYGQGEVKGHVFADVPVAFDRWKKAGRTIAIFSSGSVLAQKLLFGRTIAGDLSPFVKDYFDTTTGPKREAQSYRAIARALGLAPEQIVFVSDVTRRTRCSRRSRDEHPAQRSARKPPATAVETRSHPQFRRTTLTTVFRP